MDKCTLGLPCSLTLWVTKGYCLTQSGLKPEVLFFKLLDFSIVLWAVGVVEEEITIGVGDVTLDVLLLVVLVLLLSATMLPGNISVSGLSRRGSLFINLSMVIMLNQCYDIGLLE